MLTQWISIAFLIVLLIPVAIFLISLVYLTIEDTTRSLQSKPQQLPRRTKKPVAKARKRPATKPMQKPSLRVVK